MSKALKDAGRTVQALTLPLLLLIGITRIAAAQSTLSATYYQMAENGDPDFNTEPCCNVYSNEVLPTLGPDGLPVLNPSYNAGSADPVHDVNSSGEITWWSPAFNSNVTETGTGTITLPYANAAMFPPNAAGGNDLSGFLTAVYTASEVSMATRRLRLRPRRLRPAVTRLSCSMRISSLPAPL